MHCLVYKSSRKDETYLFVPGREAGAENPEADLSRVPGGLLEHLGTLVFVMELELTPQRKLARANVEDVRENVISRGYYLQLPPGEDRSVGARH
jgi:uncharacterized protein YcgL (UPF0745 family)